MTEHNAGRFHVTGAVMAHPRRLALAQQLSDKLPVDLRGVVTDPDPDGPPLELRTAVRAWTSIPAGATHHMLVHDDMAIVPRLLERVTRAVQAYPDAALSLFAFWGSRNGAAMRQAALTGARWVRALNEWTPTNALVLPRAVGEEFAAWAERSKSTWPVDVMLHRFLREQGVPAYVAVPNLMEHEEHASLIDNDYQGLRRSACFLPDGVADGDESPSVQPSAAPFFVAFSKPAAQIVVPIPGTQGRRSRYIQCTEYLDQFGIEVSRLRDRVRPDAAGVGEETSWAVWLTAFTMGVVNRADGHNAMAIDDPVLRASLGTIVQGGISHTTNAGAARAAAAALWPTVQDGLQAGLAMPGRTRRTPSGPRIAVPENDFVGEYLRQRLSELGRELASAPSDCDVLVLTGPCTWALGCGVTQQAVQRQTERVRAMLAGHRGRAILLSSLRVYSGHTGLVDEHTEPIAGDPVTAAILELEQVCRASGATVLRLGLPLGPGLPHDNDLTVMVGNALTSRPFAADGPAWPLPLVHLKDVAAAMVAAIDVAPTEPVFNIAGDALAEPHVADIVFRVVLRPVEDLSLPQIPGPIASADLARKVLGWRESVDVELGLHGFSQWLAHESAWEAQ